ncbi:MAG: hypothetical protein ACD_72C00346G0003 [uncultured bacterium]|nr:MAG: hypothetical protein ACD_72C00346G0003 [uncultured bacterium]
MQNNHNIRIIIGWVLGGLLVALLIFLLNKSPKFDNNLSVDGKIQVITSFYPLYYFTSQIVGDRAVVYNLTPAGSEPHDYELSTSDIARIENSQLLILNGGKLESWGDNIKNILDGSETKILTMENSQLLKDPHVWLDPILAKQEVLAIAVGLGQVDSGNASYYLVNAKILSDKLDNLDNQFKLGLNSCAKKDIITSHSAFGYLASKYGFNQVAISGLSPDEEPSVQTLTRVADFAKQNKIEYIFFESLVSPKLSQTIASEIGAKTLVLNPLEGLTDTDIRAGKNYFSEMQNNLNNLKIALQCQ